MTERSWLERVEVQRIRAAPYDRTALEPFVLDWARYLNHPAVRPRHNPTAYLITQGVGHLFDHLDGLEGTTLAARWANFEIFWIETVKGRGRTAARFSNGVFLTLLVLRLVVPSHAFLSRYKALNWIRLLLPPKAPLRAMLELVSAAIRDLPTMSYSQSVRVAALNLATGIILTNDYWSLSEFKDVDLLDARPNSTSRFKLGADVLDAALCTMGVFDRTPLRGIMRKRRPIPAPSLADMVIARDLPEEFRVVTLIYLQAYQSRISSRYSTLRGKLHGMARFWRFMKATFPEVTSTADIRPEHTQAYIPHSIASARANSRKGPSGTSHGSTTANHDLASLRTFFSDIATWSLEEGSPFRPYVPPVPPLTFRDTQVAEIAQAYRRQEAAMTRRIIDLEREMPKVRTLAYQEWQCAKDAIAQDASREAWRAEAVAFWNWAFLELLVQSGLRIEEAHNLTVFDILRRRDSHGRVYFLLHVEPSKFDKARLIPIGDSLGKVLSETIIHVKRFYGLDHVPPIDHFDFHQQQPLPRAPYLLQGRTRPHMISKTTIRAGLFDLSRRAGARRHDGTPLDIGPHDCRRVFASEHLNNGTPPHVLRALLGHERLDTVMIYAKLYPGTLVEEYRRHVRGVYQAVHGPEVLRAPTEDEWALLERSCDLRDMGTHLCALPTGDHCPKGLVCLGCVHAQPKKSALPLFEEMRANHARELTRAEARHEPLGQLASRRLELTRLDQAVRRARELSVNVAQAMENALAL
ncbi:tyrosine-type recombinase/integrase [Marinivivus vitaminiproducens]|uniref:tyrosine-type recombinase/integrase n=1 Tax=Marinivivus vitaminiproducens TaxID=3035935 RepID=UPI002799224C|nr:site-specific integrase [Geminicoccaceae bacterium SCSIO 64248]